MIICPNLSNKEVAQEFDELKSALMAADPKHGEAMAYLVWSLNNGNAIDKAPNGAESLLFKSLVDYYEGNRSKAIVAKAKTYSTSFLKWFGNWGGFKTIDTKNNLFTPTGEVNWNYFELLLNLYHNNQPDSMFSHGRYTLATRPENHFTGEKNTLNHIKFVTQSMLNLLEGKYDMDLPFVSEARASMQNQKDMMILAAMFHDAAKPYRHGDIHGWESADILRDLLGVDYNNRVAEWAVRHHMPMPFSHKAEFSLSNPEAIEVAKNIARDARRVGIDANTAINAFVLINAADIINGRELNVDDNWAKKAGEEGLKKYNGDISVKNVLSVELKEKVALLKKAFDEIKDEDFGDTAYNYSHQERFDYQAFPEGGREDKKLPYLNNTEYTGVSKVVDENGEPLVVWHGSRISNNIEEFQNDNTFFADRYTAFSYTPFDAEDEREYMYPSFLSIKNPKIIDAKGNFWNNIEGESTDDIAKSLSGNDGAIISNLKDYSDFTPGNPELSVELLNEVPLHTDYITSSSYQIKHIDNRDGEYTGPNIYHNLKDEDGNYEDEVPEVYSPFPEYDEESKQMFKRLFQLQNEFRDLKQRRLELNKKLLEAKADTISTKTIIVNGQKIRFIEKPNHLVFIDNDQRIFTLVTTKILFKGDTIEFPLLFPFERIFDGDINYNRVDNSIKNNTTRLIYEALSVLKNNGRKVVYSPWQSTFMDVEHKVTADNLKKRMSKLLGINVQDFITSEEKIVEDHEFSKYFGRDDLKSKTLYIKHFRLVFNIDTMLNRLAVLGHNKEIYDILNHIYNQQAKTEDNSLLVKALLSEEKDIDEKLTAILLEIENLNEGIRRKESEMSGLPFNKTQGSLIWLVQKYINEERPKDEVDKLVEDINYENGSRIKINWNTKKAYGEKLEGNDTISRTNDHNKERIKAVVNYLNEKFGNKIEVREVDEDTWLRDSRLYNGSNSCIIGNTVYLRKSRMTTEIAAEEMLHVLVHGMKYGNDNLGNKELFNNLFEKAKREFPKLWQEIQNVYKYNHDEELVTQVLARYFNRDFDKRDSYKVEDLINKFKKWFVKLFKTVIEEFASNYYATVGDINPLVDFEDISDMLLAKNLKFDIQTIPEIHKENLKNKTANILTEDQILHNISARQQAAEKEAQRIAVRMNVLYREYEKIKSKTPSQERLANQIFEANNELKQHMDISAIGIALEQAKLTLGQYDPITNGPAVMQYSNIYKYLYDKSQQGFTGMTPDQLVDMYRNSIKFYLDLINGIPSDRVIDLSDADKRNIELIQSLIKNYIMPLWTEAIIKVGDDIVDAQVDQEVYASDQDKADMKEVAKDWLHKNIMYGDLNIVTNYVYNYSYSSNPIIKQAFHLIQHAEQKTLEEMHHIAPKLMRAYQKANKGLNSITPGWQSVMMEFDDEGKPTGNFLRDINYGQYQKDLKNFRETLNSDFLDDYGFTYVTDDTGAIVNSLTGEYAEDEEWGPNGEMPKYVEYLRAIEIFKGPRVFRRFTENYYLERLTRPYDGTIDPMSPEFKDTRFNHGLSPKTLKRYSYYQTNINYYLNKCQDSDTGLIYPERLSSDDRLALENWNAAFDKFKDIFNEDGSYKSGEDLKMAYEVRAWQKWIGERSNSTRFQDSFNAELKRILQECQQTGNMQPYNIFLKHNASEGINPDYIEQTVGSFRSYHTETDLSYKARILRKALQDAVKSPLKYGRTLMDMKNRPLFWLHCKSSDQAIDDARDPDDKGNSGWTPQQVEEYKKKFYNREILYTDEYGQYIDENGNQVQPNSQQANILEEEGKLLTVRQYLINYYTDEALRNGHVEGLIDESTGNYVDFSGMTAVDIKNLITKLMSYRRRNFEEDGSITEEYVPLTIFSMLWPTEKEFHNKRTGKREKTIVYLGEGRFKESYSSFTTSALDFNPNEGIAEKPNTTFDNGRYDNSVKYKEMRENLDVADLYDDLIETMLNMLSIYSTNRKFNFRLPQINARMSALFSRIIKRGYSEKSLSAIWNAMTNIEANDDDMRTKEDYFVGVDGEVANTVPLKFIRNLKNPEDISTDLVSSVIMFADMALNYKNKTAIDSTLKVLRYNMDEATRMTDKNRYGLFGGKLESNEYSKLMFDSMLNSHMYGNQWTGKNKQGGPSRTKIATFKTVEAFLSFESGAMLGLNFFSMSVGFADSLTRIFSESAAGKYMTPGDCLFALGVCLWNTPKCIKNMFNPLANNKMTALMLMNGISKGTYGIYTKADWGKGRKFFTNLLMGGWSMLDWMANSLLMVAFYHNCRFYDGNEIPKGFYTKYEMQKEFAKIGKSKSYANTVHHNWSNYGRRVTLWDAYYYNGKGEVFVKPEYEQYVTQRVKTNIATKTKKRGALYNGMNPDNDVPQWKRDVIGRLVGALRAWIPQQIQHLFAGGTDNIVRGIYEETKYQTTSSGTRAIPVLTNMTQAEVDAILAEKSRAIAAGENTTSKEFKKRIKDIRKLVKDVENSRRFSWDYETGTTQDQIIVGLWRSINTIYRKINQWALHKPRTAKLSEVEKYAMKDAIIFMAMLSLMMVGWTYTHDWAREVPKPKDRYEAGPMSWWNPVDYYNYMRDVYIPNEYWRLAVDDIYFRTIEAKISNISPFQVLDIVNAATALKSGADDQFNLLGLGWDLINGSEDIDAIQKQGAYKFYTQGERNFYRGIGFLKNTHTFLTYEGATNNLRWYTNRFGRVFRMVGYDFKAKDKEKQKIEGFQGGDFSGGNFQGGDFSGGNFEGGNF